MSWIQENKFVATLSGVTLVGAALLAVVGARGCSKYNSEKARFDSTSDEVAQYEKLPLYPKEENRNGKEKALKDYIAQTQDLQVAFEKYRPSQADRISPQDFTDHLKTADTELRKAFGDSKTTLPDRFFLGFEPYTSALARDAATGILDYQLQGVKSILLSLAAAKPSEVLNVHRPKLPEEDGQEFKPAPEAVSRALPLEIAFRGTEKSLREFLSSVSKNSEQFVVIRSIRVTNEKATAPSSSDAKFASPEAAAPAENTGFILPGSDSAPAAPAAPVVDTSPVLIQVLGNEQLSVFVRLDILQFLPAKALPKP